MGTTRARNPLTEPDEIAAYIRESLHEDGYVSLEPRTALLVAQFLDTLARARDVVDYDDPEQLYFWED